MTALAIFDLDRTLIAGPSGPVFQRHLAEAGVSNAPELPVLDALYKVYEVVGENPLSMQAARLAVRGARGWSVPAVAKAAEAAAEELIESVLPYGRLLIDEHREAGRLPVLATTSPRCFVQPLADRLGMGEVFATEWATDGDVYNGHLHGRFLWGRNKMTAIKAWAREHKVDLGASYAYSDSVYDVPMLRTVGHPVAVNPDAQLAMVARLNQWPIRHFDVPPGVVKIAGRELQDWLRPLNRPEMAANARFDIQGAENIPKEGAAIVVFNHRSYFDSSAINFTLAKTDRPARFLGKKEVFDAPVIGALSKMMGGIRVDRGTGSDEPLEHAIHALEAGEMVSLAPQGTIPRGPAFFDTELKGRWGAARLAHATRAPVIPIGVWGTEKVWPRNQRLPKMAVTEPPTITVRVGPPVELRYRSLDADTKRIMSAIVDLLPPEAKIPHTPTDEELALTYPPGYNGDPTQEIDRRPGTDT
ncbi:MAG: HAD-IB family hydrolase [Acidimicrobiia bacterium]|nr:HAD-IB family hydrolase [Acidimicrobiia bacterium]